MSVSSRFTGAAARLLRARWLVRAPVWLYRARLGILLGPRFVMLEHTGRKSGARRYVVLSARHPRAWAAMKSVLQDTLASPAADVESRLPVIALDLGPES